MTKPSSCEACSAFTRVAACTLARSPYVVTAIRRLQTLRLLHACSGRFRLERSPGGACTHWKSAALSRRTWKADICNQLHPAPWSSHLAIVRVAGPATGNWQVRGHRREVRRHDRAAGRLLTRPVAIGDCHGQELNRRNLHDPALSPAQVEPRPLGLAVARRQTKGLENGIPDWKSVSLVRRARKYPRAPHAGLPRRRSHAFATSASREWNITSCTCRARQGRPMRGTPIKRNARSHAVGEDRSSPSRIGLDLVWNNPN